MRYCKEGYREATKAMVLLRRGEGARVPGPPGMIRTSSGGAVSKVWVGRTPSLNVEFATFVAHGGSFVETGLSVSAISERFMFVDSERMFNASRGPKTSSASNPGNIIYPKRVGTIEYLSKLHDCKRRDHKVTCSVLALCLRTHCQKNKYKFRWEVGELHRCLKHRN